jgi:hypothetical protein
MQKRKLSAGEIMTSTDRCRIKIFMLKRFPDGIVSLKQKMQLLAFTSLQNKIVPQVTISSLHLP